MMLKKKIYVFDGMFISLLSTEVIPRMKNLIFDAFFVYLQKTLVIFLNYTEFFWYDSLRDILGW